ncbi:calcium/calmodulin-dependent protein kinase type, putative [Theileria equi strain WA]|uniref:Calcium/calmodulin-dependent protein kinase type, putative n=1 Tax=Theileria equi strain WA TaxID=1537102 RepID=L0AVN6_THEEQ|nr:calcium/calmodulin-dependent protein kinase type, putative [Theileria equi strain WA]AFZ79672.1 calcium/calmodulin-dependent protein kinase type, putative [Theileria equi strain WA]|eukprot:XP_004829338.1 calcium/calmodulin-dependent protein kinase type, putative [Theileria equi strain WA]
MGACLSSPNCRLGTSTSRKEQEDTHSPGLDSTTLSGNNNEFGDDAKNSAKPPENFDHSGTSNNTSNSLATIQRSSAKNTVEGTNKERGIQHVPDYMVPDISDVFYTNLDRPRMSVHKPKRAHSDPDKTKSTDDGAKSSILRNLSEYPRISDVVLTNDVWRIRILSSVKLTSRYILGTNAIGYGVCGSVRHAVNRRTQKVYALKSLSTYTTSKRKLTSVFNEVSIFTQLDHPNIAFMHEAYDELGVCHIIMEYCSGSELYDRLDTYKRFSEQYAIKLTFQMLLTLHYLHTNGICHRDLKLENWVFADQEIDSPLKMIDFGFARVFEKGIPMGGMHGTVYYVDPEVIDGCYNEKCDIWSTGVIVYMMLSGSPPFNSEGDKEILWKIKRATLRFEGVRWTSVSDTAKDFIRYLLNRNGNERPSAEMALRHEWLKSEYMRYSNFKVPVELLKHIIHFSRKSPLHRVVIALSVLESDRQCPKEVYRAFFAINTRKNGTISFDEFYTAMKSHLDISHQECIKVYNTIGYRGTPELNYTEFVTAVIEHYGILDINMLSLVYKKLDVLGKGFIDLKSFTAAIGKYFNDVSAEEIFRNTDQNQDGFIDFVEFCESLTAVNPEV